MKEWNNDRSFVECAYEQKEVDEDCANKVSCKNEMYP